jgi:hypothetical protein
LNSYYLTQITSGVLELFLLDSELCKRQTDIDLRNLIIEKNWVEDDSMFAAVIENLQLLRFLFE